MCVRACLRTHFQLENAIAELLVVQFYFWLLSKVYSLL